MKKTLSLILVFALLLSSLCAFAASDMETIGRVMRPGETYKVKITYPGMDESKYVYNGDSITVESISPLRSTADAVVTVEIEDSCNAHSAMPENEIHGVGDVLCPSCGKTANTTPGSTRQSTTYVASSDTCYFVETLQQLFCAYCGTYRGEIVISINTVHAHSWGGLNPDGYTHSCTRCGYTDKA